MNFFTLKVIEILQETSDTVTLCFKQPGLKKIIYQPGQYLTLIFRINGRRYIRPYSFSSAPGIDSTLNVTVKRVSSGIVSNHIVDRVAVGDIIEVMPPMGDFLIDWDRITENTNIVLWGIGSGITPLMSIAKFLLAGHKNHVTLVYGNRDFESAIFAGQIDDLKSRYSNFSVWHFHTKFKVSSIDAHLVEGRIAPGKVIAVLKDVEQLNDSLHYICGPVGLKESLRLELGFAGISADRIYSEDFEIVKDPKEFENITTHAVKINNEGITGTVEVVKGKSILEAGLDAGLELPYACQTGNCSVCKGTLIQGAAKMIGLTKRPVDLADDEYLLCCTYPLSEDVKIEV